MKLWKLFAYYQFPFYICTPKKYSLKELILEKTRELFLTIGFKSVTMDQIANAMGISKKTIYNFFENKTELVKAVTSYMFNSITKGITEIKESHTKTIKDKLVGKLRIPDNITHIGVAHRL